MSRALVYGARCSLRSDAPAPAPTPTWRVTTAVRVFGLAVLVGQVLDRHALDRFGVVVVGLCIVAAASSAGELQAPRGRMPWISVAEGLMVGLLVGVMPGSAAPLVLYLAIPPVVAGITGGRIGTANTWLAMVTALVGAAAAGDGSSSVSEQVGPAVLWLALGLGAGLLAAHQARTLRNVESAQAPYAAAQRLVSQLHMLLRSLPEVLDVPTQARAIRDALSAAAGVDRAVVFVARRDTLAVVPTGDVARPGDEAAARACFSSGRRHEDADVVALPLRVGQHVIGVVSLPCTHDVIGRVDQIQELLDEHAIRLQTATLVEDVRLQATTEERNRLAREIHDGVAQRVVSLGYLADEIAATSETLPAREGAEALRAEISKLIGELRISVFDLRHQLETSGGLSAALSEYVRELSTRSDLRVHLTLDVRSARLAPRTECEMLRIAQEAIGNVHRHARAINVWVNLRVVGEDVRLVVEDDGVGGAAPRNGHYGMHTMRERADRICADLEVGARHDGGTIVTVRSRAVNIHTTGERHDQRLARR